MSVLEIVLIVAMTLGVGAYITIMTIKIVKKKKKQKTKEYTEIKIDDEIDEETEE